jgi:flagellin-like hook-associated protein FlgL
VAFSINTNIDTLLAYNALVKTNADTLKSQLRLATLKKINSVADDTSGYNVGKQLEAQSLKQKSQLNNVSSAKNYLSTAETALQQINDKFNQISAKYVDAQDPLKDKDSIAKDIRTLASEIDSILKNTNINGHNLLAQSDGTALAANDIFDLGGNTFTVDFASSSYLNVDTVKSSLEGGTVVVPDPGDDAVFGNTLLAPTDAYAGAAQTSTVTTTFADGTSSSFNVSTAGCSNIGDLYNAVKNAAASANPGISIGWAGAPSYGLPYALATGSYITSLKTTSGNDIIGTLGLTREVQNSTTTTGGLLSTDTDTIISAASNLTAAQDNVRSALGRIGNLIQTADSRSEFLTASLANNTATISSIFDADVAEEQLKVTKGNIGIQIGTAMFSQLNTAPQQLLSLF